ncbi:hypothetical protein GOODEAATRI_030620, partial [Goodea atripinnis]
GSDYEDIDAEIDKELKEYEKPGEEKRNENRGQKPDPVIEDEERWPSPMEPLEYDIDQESASKSSPVVPPPPETDEQTYEEKKYILEKIQQANKELQEQETPDITRRRRLHFKETLVDLVVPPLHFQADSNSTEIYGENSSKDRAKVAVADTEVLGKMSELKLSPRNESKGFRGSNSEELQETKESKVLVEKDGKFDLVSMKDVENQSVLPPIANNLGNSTQSSPRIHQQVGKTYSSFSSPQLRIGSSSFHLGIDQLRAPRPPTQPRIRPSSASHSQRVSQRRNSKRRVQSATGTPCQVTYTLSPQQKELLQKIQERKERLARERDSCDPEEAFKLWLQRKQEQQQKERQLVELRKLEEDSSYLLHSREECERAFKLWLKQKRVEKRAEQQAAREHSRRLVLEERRARRMRDLMCTVNETKPFRFMEQVVYRF